MARPRHKKPSTVGCMLCISEAISEVTVERRKTSQISGQMDGFAHKWNEYIPEERKGEFYNDLVKVMEFYRQRGEENPRQPESMGH